MKTNKKNLILGLVLVLLLLVVGGVTYAFFTYENGERSEIVTGQIYMNYEETSTISLTGVFPETKAQALARQDENGVFEFTITGRNTSKYPVYYEIDLLEGGVITGATAQSTRILPEHVRIYLERDGEPLVDGETYADWNNRRIYVDTVPANQTNNIEHKYTLRMWIDENVTISDTDPNADYKTTEWNGSYASLQVRVVGDFEEKTLLEETDVSCFTYDVLNQEEIEIIDYDGTCGRDVVIPSTIEGLPVTRIAGYDAYAGSRAFWNIALNSVKLPNTLEYIGDAAFYYTHLTQIIIPDSVTEIGEYAFWGSDLTEVVIPDSVTTIGARAFENNKLTTIVLGKNVSDIGSSAFSIDTVRSFNPIEKVVNKSINAFNWTLVFSIGENKIVQDPGIVATGTYIYTHSTDGNKTVLITSE